MSAERNPGILLVDDEPGVLAMCEGSLITLPIVAYRAESAKAALDVLRQCEGIRVVLTDYSMPGMSGVALLAVVRRAYPAVARVLFTGLQDMRIAQEATLVGDAFRVLVKPVAPQVLRQVAAEGLRLSERLRSAASPASPATLGGSREVVTRLAVREYARQAQLKMLAELQRRSAVR